jgi:hypothetical protein
MQSNGAGMQYLHLGRPGHLALLIAFFVAIAVSRTEATPVAGDSVFLRPLNGGVAISVQAILKGDSDSAQIPILVGPADTTSAMGGSVWRTNDWLYYSPPASLVATDSFHYVLSNVLSETATGTVTVVASPDFEPTNLLNIALLPGGGRQLQFIGDPGSYFIQTSSNLVNWTNVAARLAWPTNYFSFVDTNPTATVATFYRTATGALAPAITNYQASGTANVPVDFTVGVEGGVNSPYPATVLTLPARGYLFRDDGSILSNAPAGSFGPNGSLHYFGIVSGGGTDTVSFQYKLTRPGDGLDSLPATFRIALAADVPAPATAIPNVPENGGSFIQLAATDPDLRYASNHLAYRIIFPPTRGKLFQVNLDGSVNYSEPITNEVTYVSNGSNLVYYVPPAFQTGTPFESFTWQAVNSFGATSILQSLPINVYFVNSPPVAGATLSAGWIDDPGVQVYPQDSDPDNNLQTITISTLPARGQLHLMGNSTPSGIVSATNNTFHIPGSGGVGFIFLPDSETNGMPCIPDELDYGSPYATYTYVVTDAGGLSATNTGIINILPLKVPFPHPATADVIGLLNSSNVPVTFAATNLGGGLAVNTTFTLTQAPTHGTFYIQGFPILPDTLPTDLPLTNIVYVPDPGYYSSRDGIDSFAYRTSDGYDAMNCNAQVRVTILAPPTLALMTNAVGASVIVTEDSSGNLVSPGVSTNVDVIAGDAPTNALMQVTFSAQPVGSPPYGYFALNSTNGLTGISTNVPVTLQFEGTLAALNTVLTNNGISYYPRSSSAANTISVTLSDLGAIGLGTNVSSVTLHVFYRCSNCGIGL